METLGEHHLRERAICRPRCIKLHPLWRMCGGLRGSRHPQAGSTSTPREIAGSSRLGKRSHEGLPLAARRRRAWVTRLLRICRLGISSMARVWGVFVQVSRLQGVAFVIGDAGGLSCGGRETSRRALHGGALSPRRWRDGLEVRSASCRLFSHLSFQEFTMSNGKRCSNLFTPGNAVRRREGGRRDEGR